MQIMSFSAIVLDVAVVGDWTPVAHSGCDWVMSLFGKIDLDPKK